MSALHSTNTPSHRLSRDETMKIVADFQEGLSIARLAKKYGISRPTVYRAIERGTASKAAQSKEVRVYTRLSIDDHEALKVLAELRGETVAALSRRVLRRAAGFFDADKVTADAALALSNEIKKIGNNLNQVVYQVNREALLQGRAAPQPKYLTDIKSMQVEILEIADKVDSLLVRAGRSRLTTVQQLLEAED